MRNGDEPAPTRTPTPQQSPSVLSAKSFDSTVVQGNVDAPAAISRPLKDKTKKDHPSETFPGFSGTKGSLPTPLPVSECKCFAIFYAEFDIKVGPKVCFQSPRGFMEQDMDMPLEKIHSILRLSFESIQSEYDTGEGNKGTTETAKSETLLSNPADDSKDDSMSIFDTCNEYIITGSELTGNLLNLSSHHMHILTRPTVLENERYERNSLLFCVGFVLRRAGDPRLFRPILSKWALMLRDLEVETAYLSTERTRRHLQGQLDRMLVSFNSAARECFLQLAPGHVLCLRLFHPPRPPPEPVKDHDVPVLLRRDRQFQMFDWDLSINWVCCHIDGVATARQISKIAEVDMEMVRQCLRVLKHHGFVALIDMFFFTNRYETVSTKTHSFLQPDDKLLTEAVAFCLKGQTNPPGSQENSPSLHGTGSPTNESSRSLMGTSLRMNLATSAVSTTSDAILQRVQRRDDYTKVRTALAELYNACSRSESFGEMWLSILSGEKLQREDVNWRKMFSLIDHRRFATFGVVHGLLRRIHNFPLFQNDPQQPTPESSHKVATWMDGKHCDDSLCCEFDKPLEELMEIVGRDRVISLYARY